MTGSLGVINPSVEPPRHFARGPWFLGSSQGAYPVKGAAGSVVVTGAGSGTSVGRGVTLAQSEFVLTGLQFRDFAAFANVAQVSFNYLSFNSLATFAAGGGPLAACPGPGCTGTISPGSGSAISWCPPNAYSAASPAPGTAAAQVGNWNCSVWNNPGTGNQAVRLHIEAQPGGLKFGGTLRMLRNTSGDTWRVGVQPSTPNATDAVATRSIQTAMAPWTGGAGNGLGNFGYTTNAGARGPKVNAQLNAVGAVIATFGCAAPFSAGSVGQAFSPGNPVGAPGVNCGTNPIPANPGQGWGFKMSTGFMSGSDFFPGVAITTAAGTPFAPVAVANNPTNPFSPPFFFTRQGGDVVVGTGTTAARNIVLLGGGIAADPNSGNLFFNNMNLTLNLVPEPSMGLGLLAGIVGIGFLARRRRSR